MSNEINHIEAVKRFVNAVKKGRNPMPYAQLTWKETTKNKDIVIQTLKENAISGKIHVNELREISPVCHLVQLKTAMGNFSIKVIKEKEAYKTDINGSWGVNPLSIRHFK